MFLKWLLRIHIWGVCLLPFIVAEAQNWEDFGLVEKKSDYDPRIFKHLGNAFLSIDLEFLHALSSASAECLTWWDVDKLLQAGVFSHLFAKAD